MRRVESGSQAAGVALVRDGQRPVRRDGAGYTQPPLSPVARVADKHGEGRRRENVHRDRAHVRAAAACLAIDHD